MKKVLSFCVLSVLLAVLSLGLKAQSGLVLTPANLPDPIVLNQYDTVYISPNSDCFDSLGLANSDQVSIEWQILYNGSVIPNDSLSYYFEEFKFESRYDLGMAERWWGRSYTSHYCQNGDGYGSYPGANTPTAHLELGQQCEDPGHFNVSLPGQNNPYQFDYFYVRWFRDAANTAHRLVYNIKVDGQYELVFTLAKRCGGTKWDDIYEDNDEHYYVGGHMSEVCEILSSDTLHTIMVDTMEPQFTCLAQLPWCYGDVCFPVGTPDGVYDTLAHFNGVSSCGNAVDSIIYFTLTIQDPQAPVLDTLASTLMLCDSGDVTFVVNPQGADKVIWYDDTDVALDTTTGSYTMFINANTEIYVKSFSAEGCISSDSIRIFAEVKASPTPVVTATPDTLCENSALQITLDQEYDAWTWFHDGTDMNLDTIVYDVADAAMTDAGLYWATVSENHVHSVYPTVDTIACSAADSVQVTVFERPVVAWASLDGNTVTDSITFCPNDLDHIFVATISGGQAPYDNIHWTGVAGTETYDADKASDTLSITLANTCGAAYTVGIDYAIDANGCTLKDTIEVAFFVNDTVAPTVTKTGDTVSAQAYANCEYIIPDVMGIITTSDNCGIADTTQVPAAGALVTTDTIVVVTVTDLCGNTATDTINVRLPVDELVIDTIEVTATVLCAGDANGAIRITVAGGTAPYDVQIVSTEVSDSIYTQHGAADQTVFDFAGLIKGTWNITVTDTNGCQVIVNDTANVASPNVLTLTSSDWTDLTCFESNDGSFKFNVKQGTLPYEVTIVRTLGSDTETETMTLNPSVLDTIVEMTNQKAGVYEITVVDGNNCTTSVTDTLTQPDQLVLVGDTVLNHVKCFGESNGNLAVTEVTGGTYPYYYAWVNEVGDTVSNDSVTGRILPAGAYTIYITDANNCAPNQTLTDTIKQPEMALNVVSIDAPVSDTCPRLHTYTFNATVEGGRPNYEFEWTFNNVVAQTTPNVATTTDAYDYIENTISCDTTFEVIFKVTDDSACVAMDTISFTISDTVVPTLTGVLDTLYIDGCTAAGAGDTLNTIAKLQTAGLTIDDNCTAVDALTVNFSETVTGTCPIEVVRTYTVTDSCGLTSAEVKHVIYVQDTTRPTYVRPADTILYLSATCTVDTLPATTGEPTSLDDNCTLATNLVVSHRDVVAAGCGSTYTISRYWKVVDECGNVSLSDSVQTITVSDTTAPVFTTHPANRAVACDGAGNTIQHNSFVNSMAGAVAEDNCALDSIAMVLDSVVQGCNSATQTYYYSFTAVDFCGNETTEYATFSIYDSVAPIFTTIAPDVVMECSIDDLDTIRINSLALFSYDDACSHAAAFLSDSLSDFVKGCGSTGDYTHFVTITDSCQTTTVTHLISIVDTKDPVFTNAPAANPVVECDGLGNLTELYAWLYSVTALDSCSGPIDSIQISYVNTLGDFVPFDSTSARDAYGHYVDAWRPVTGVAGTCEGYYRFNWKAVDSCGNFVTTTEDFRILNRVGPEFTQTRTDTTVDCEYLKSDFVTWLTLSDAVEVCTGNSYPVTWDTVFVPACGSTGVYQVTWTSTDDCGNSTVKRANWTIIDTAAPEILTVNAGNILTPDTIYHSQFSPWTAPAITEWEKTGMDKDESDQFIIDFMKGNPITADDMNTYIIRDSAGVTSITDCGWIKDFFYTRKTSVASSDVCVEQWTIDYVFRDACNNTITLTQEIFVLDTSAPFVNNIADIKYFLGPDDGCAKEPVDTFYTIGQLNAYDANQSTDDAAATDLHLNTTDLGYLTLDSVVTVAVSAARPCDSLEIRYYTISDMCGNSTTFTHKITYRDTLAPQLNITEMYDSIHQKGFGSCDLYTEIADENLYNNLLDETWLNTRYGLVISDCHDHQITFDGESIETDDAFCPGKVFARRYKVEKNCDPLNPRASYFTVYLAVKDTIAPELVVTNLTPATVYMTNPTECGYTVPNVHFTSYEQLVAWEGSTVAQDCNLGTTNNVTLIDSVIVGSGCTFDINYRYTIQDSCGNVSDTLHLTITVEDTLAPMVTNAYATLNDTMYYELDCSIPTLNYWTMGQDALDHGVEMADCNPAWDDASKLVRLNETSERDVCTTIYTVRYQVKDACTDHVSDTIYQTILILDTVAPVVSPTALKDSDTYMVDDAADCWGPDVAIFTTVGEVKAYDNTFTVTDCNVGDDSQVRLERTDSSDIMCTRTVVRTYVVLDSCGLVSNEFTHTINVIDTTAPAITAVLTPQQVYMDPDCNFTYTTYATIADLPTDMQNGIKDCNLKAELIKVTADTLEIGGTDCDKAFTVFVTYHAQDSCGYVTPFNDTIYVADTTAPRVVGALDTLTIYLSDVCDYTVPTAFANTDELLLQGVTVTDCKLMKELTVSSIDTIHGYCPMFIHRTYTVSDSCGHTTTIDEFFNVSDTLAPTITDNTLDTVDLYIDVDSIYLVPAAYTTVTELLTNGAAFTDCNLIDAIDSVHTDTTLNPAVCNGSFVLCEYFVIDSCDNLSDPIYAYFKLIDTVSPWLDVTLPDYDAERTANDCEFIVPNLHDTVAAHYVDNWSAFTTYEQIPAAGYVITNFRDTVVMVAFGDVCGNMDTVYVTINVPDELVVDTVYMTEPNCYDESNGTITVEVLGGTADYIYSYGVPAANDTIAALTTTFNNIHADFYTVTVTDANGCSAHDTITVTQPTQLVITPAVSDYDICDNQETEISLSITGGTADYTIYTILLDNAEAALDTIFNQDATTYTMNVALDSGSFYVAFYGVDDHGCEVGDTSALISVHPTYLYEQAERICFGEVDGYDWVDEFGVVRRTLSAADFPVADTTYILYDSLHTVNFGCDSVYMMRLYLYENGYLTVRRLTETSDWSYVLPYVDGIRDTFNTASSNVGWEIFVNNCTSCKPEMAVSLEYELYRLNEATDSYELMGNVTDYFQPEYRTFFDNYQLPFTQSNNSLVSIPDLYEPHGAGHDWDFDYLNLCWLAPDYIEANLPSDHAHTASGDFYADARANTIMITGFGSPLYDGEGDYKIVVTLNKRGGTLSPAMNYSWNLALPHQVGGNSSTIVEPLDALDIFFHVEASSSPVITMPTTEPIGGAVVFSSNKEVAPEANVFPNPARDFVQVELSGFEGQTSVQLSSPAGKVLQTINLDIADTTDTPIIKIATGDYAQGVYMITARSKETIITKRVVIIK